MAARTGPTFPETFRSSPDKAGELYHITRVEPSRTDAGTAYLAVDGHRFDDQKPYLYVTRDYGATWSSVVGNLPSVAPST
jgi:hypothetical protein